MVFKLYSIYRARSNAEAAPAAGFCLNYGANVLHRYYIEYAMQKVNGIFQRVGLNSQLR
jgi:hypothetical protein